MRLATEREWDSKVYEALCVSTERRAMAWIMPRIRPEARLVLWAAMLPESRLRLVRIYQRRCDAVAAGRRDYSFADYRRGEVD